MDADAARLKRLIEDRALMRRGRKLKRTLYLMHPEELDDWEHHLCVGAVDSELLAELICELWNREMSRLPVQ